MQPIGASRATSLRRQSMTASEISAICFNAADSTQTDIQHHVVQALSESFVPSKHCDLIGISDEINAIVSRTSSRSGRKMQRFASDSNTGITFRLTTGSVPIMSDGRILLVSSGRTDDWILPKGGWESDETLEFGALRETFEEAGVLGTLGPKLSSIEYETRKAKLKRIELEAMSENLTKSPLATNPSHESSRASSFMSEDDVLQNTCDVEFSYSSIPIDGSSNISRQNSNEASRKMISKEELETCSDSNSSEQKSELEKLDDTTSKTSSSICTESRPPSSHVRLCMFTMYVSEVRETWPESDRARKVFDIDTAIQLMTNRPEFLAVLLEVKRNRYHLTSPFHPQHSN